MREAQELENGILPGFLKDFGPGRAFFGLRDPDPPRHSKFQSVAKIPLKEFSCCAAGCLAGQQELTELIAADQQGWLNSN